ncbi:MAG TPA: hypothetical protein VJ810_08585 [Blastocatellia bacterium]|nr:hypothetical protein [Blastocatellia bacterium]
MKISTISFLILTVGLCLSADGQKAKRSAPKEVTPIAHEGVRYTAHHWVWANGRRIAGGYIEAFNAKTSKRLWRIKVYEAKSSPQLEKDVQDVFITSIAIENDKLIVVNERNERYEMDLKTRKVAKR